MRSLALSTLLTTTLAWQFDWPTEWSDKWTLGTGHTQQAILGDESCKVSHIGAFEMQKTREPAIFFGSGGKHHPLSPKLIPLNSTGAEQWEFDGVSADGKMAFVFGFYRDPNYSIMGSGNLRVSSEMVWANGTRFIQVDYPTENIIEECAWGFRGVWRSEDVKYQWEITADMQTARIGIKTPAFGGNIVMKSVSRPRFPDGKLYPNENASTEALPYFHFADGIPGAHTDVDMIIQGEKFAFKGIGGMSQIWAAFSWFTCLQGMQFIRLMAGPYALTMYTFTSNIKKGAVYPSIMLFENGVPVFGSQNTQESDTEDYFTWTRTYGGKVFGKVKDKVTGYELELVSHSTDKHWTFIVEHEVVAFEFILGGGTGGTGFSASVQGGQVAREQFIGAAMTEALTFPKKSPLFKTQYSED